MRNKLGGRGNEGEEAGRERKGGGERVMENGESERGEEGWKRGRYRD